MTLLQARENGQPHDAGLLARRSKEAVFASVAEQAKCGIDVVNDGEQGKPSFLTYVNSRLGGFEPGGPREGPWADSRELRDFPEFYASAPGAIGPTLMHKTVCTGPIVYRGQKALEDELSLFREALAGKDVAEAFVPSISPSNIEEWQENRYYKSDEEFLFAIAEAMREEYEAIVSAGFVLQIDDPRLATYYCVRPDMSVEDIRRWAVPRVEALNHALRNIPREKIRFHTCYGINVGPRIHDMELKDFIDIMLRVNAGAFSFEAANPRHDHEWKVWADTKLPDGIVLIPGVITHSTVLVEHPELVADRIRRYAGVVGRENVIAGADCGFATFATSREIPADVVWAKMHALVEGARLASRDLWGGA